MSFWKNRSTSSAKRVLKYAVLAGIGAQIASIGAIIAVDAHRKRRNPQSGEFPHLPPRSARVSDSEVTVYTFGNHLYDAMIEAIDNAKDRVYFESYIMKADDVGYRFRNALIAAAMRGVQVFIILDTLGNLNQDPKSRRFPPLPSLHVIRFPLLRPWILTARSKDSGFDHRKILVVDGEVGFVGGYNIGRLYADHWRDTHIRVVGPRSWELECAFIDMWNVYRASYHPVLPDNAVRSWVSTFTVSQNIPAYRSYPIRATYLDTINRASKNVWITMGYFIPDYAIKASLINAAKRGVDVRILIPQYSNHIIADWVGRPHYSELLAAGCRIFLYKDAMVHAKTMTVDGIWTTVGTANLDRLSMAGNYEVNAEIFDADLAAIMEETFELDMTNCVELTREEWDSRTGLARLAERLMRPLAPFV
ncbi:phospholipase D-like domain-containing protein [Arcanobacterium haemolyticum]|uniref:Phospholipase D/Transphosphatidylase n=1 Tax=Arcanobacterium haemolyticum (strain ATCC 9345 / DSM 20595 / CCM 5947 / CCUG 17215 / LMG 16163 / NBRC 15585 / NCTC 8452 / 11018) TaxID=644284 RepID=D7BMM3_ARCHD|nr:phospholipase D-like domain-containing protein [Arcanobacterium haemolyticum]ADH92172.1 phospholipase D/Transphosphatidylase [Arcanobacterium haemolyticum DSM 20595]SQH29123.1 Cardiolipin synthase [Arcanobacterium haemolyticum]